MPRITPPTEPEVVYISKRNIYKDHEGKDKPAIRYANVDLAPTPQDVTYQYATIRGQKVLRETEAGRRNLRATFLESDRRISGLSLNLFTESTGNLHPKGSVTLWGDEVNSLLKFIETMRILRMHSGGKMVVEAGSTDHPLFASDREITQALRDKPELLKQVLENPNLDKDMRALGYWRSSLNRFEKLLNDRTYFDIQISQTSRNSSEQVWQEFFEKNRWIFGYGLLYISTVGVANDKLEQSLQSGSIFGGGSRPDAVLKTRGAISNLCLAEIKIHSTPLVSKERRGGSFLITKDLSDAVSQCQTAISVAEERIQRHYQPIDSQGNPSSDPVYGFRPRSILIIGNLTEFSHENGINEEKFRTFEMYRRSLVSPEIITFDELYDRARSLINDKL